VKKNVIKYAVATGVALALCLLTLWLHGFSLATELVDKYRILADAFTIPGVIILMVGCLVWISTTGFFDILAFAFSNLGARLIPFFGAKSDHESYYDYKMRKDKSRAKGYAFLFVVGAVFVVIALVFTALHESVYVPHA
jgi:hypothetical protein